jgi:hypothetical protein
LPWRPLAIVNAPKQKIFNRLLLPSRRPDFEDLIVKNRFGSQSNYSAHMPLPQTNPFADEQVDIGNLILFEIFEVFKLKLTRRQTLI